MILAATTGTIDPRRLRESERSKLETWARESERARADCMRRGFHVAAGARIAVEQPALHLLYRHIDDINAHLDKETVRTRLSANRTRAPEELAEAGCPILCIAGDEDIVIPPCAAHVPRAGHSAYFERAAEFNRPVEEFLEQVEPRPHLLR